MQEDITLDKMKEHLIRQIASQSETVFKKPDTKPSVQNALDQKNIASSRATSEAKSPVKDISSISDITDGSVNKSTIQKILKEDWQSIIAYLVKCLKGADNIDKNIRHDAAKAVGYLARTGAFNAEQKMILKNVICDMITNEPPPGSIAFAMLEALERVDTDAFWSLIMGWYGTINRNNPE